MQIKYKGVAPIEKNVIVVDEQGNEYEATYPKRAKGLVKNGRARFIDEHTICLACPPHTKTEDDFMSENIAATETVTTSKYTIEYILEQMEKIAADTSYLHNAIQECTNPIGGDSLGELAIGLGNMIEAREHTNQQLISFYKEIYHDLKPTVLSGKDKVIHETLKILENPMSTADDKDRVTTILRELMLS